MSFIFTLIKSKEQNAAGQSQSPPQLLSIKDQSCFVLPNGKIVDLLHSNVTDSNSENKLFSDVEIFLANSQKVYYLENIEYHLPPILQWMKPESGLFLGIRSTIRKISGETDHNKIELILKNNLGIFDFFANFFRTTVNVYKYSLTVDTGLSLEVSQNILFGLVEYLKCQNFEDIIYPVMHKDLVKTLFAADLEWDSNKSQVGLFDRHVEIEPNFINCSFLCMCCKLQFANSKDLKEHVKHEHKEYSCLSCEIDFDNYEDLMYHTILFCRRSFGKVCAYCSKESNICICKNNFQNTLKEVHNQNLEMTLLSESFQFFNDNILKPEHIKQVQVASNNKVPGKIDKSFWPKFKLLKTEWGDDDDEDESGMVQIFDVKMRIHDLKQCIGNYFQNFLELKLQTLQFLHLMREDCTECSFVSDANHFFTAHLFCPEALRMENDEFPIAMGPKDILQHLNDDHGWSLKNQEFLKCNICSFECQGDSFLKTIAEHSFQHKPKEFWSQCPKQGNPICQHLTFGSLEDYCIHCLTFHHDKNQSFQNDIIKMLNFSVMQGRNQKMTSATPKITGSKAIKLFPCASIPINGTNNNINSVCSEDKGFYNMFDNINTSSVKTLPNMGSDEFYCKNEDHQVPLRFKSIEHKKYHIIREHRCFYDKCHFSAEFNSELMTHYENCHGNAKNCNTECELCGSMYEEANKLKHMLAYHQQCSSCRVWFAGWPELNKHESSCKNVVESKPINKVETTSFVTQHDENLSLNIDKSSIDSNFSRALIGMLEAADLPKETKDFCAKAIEKHASESLIAKHRMRGNGFSHFKYVSLLFDVPSWSEPGKEQVSKIQALLGPIKESDIFSAKENESNKYAIKNYESILTILKRLEKVIVLCNLSQSHGRVLLQDFLDKRVQESICVYQKCEFHDLSYKKILETIQYLYVPIDLTKLESKILSYRPEKGETMFVFAARARRHLSICSKSLSPSERADYCESHLRRLIRQNLGHELSLEVTRKESVFSAFNSQELLDIIMEANKKINAEAEPDCVFNTSVVTRQSNNKQPGMSEMSKSRFRQLGPKFNPKDLTCFLCLQTRDHISRDCPNYRDCSLASTLCYINGEPHGFHHRESCLEQQSYNN